MATAIRYNDDGSIDETFGDNGFAFANTEGGFYYGAKSTMQSDGKILISGRDLVAGVGRIGLVRINNTGTPVTDVDLNNSIILNEFELLQNYPNPFNPTTMISFKIAKEDNYKLQVFNLLGEEVATLVNKTLQNGIYVINFNVNSTNKRLTSGVYFYTLSSGSMGITKKMILLR